MKTFYSLVLTSILVLYPFTVYFGLSYLSARNIAGILLVVVAARFLCFKEQQAKLPWLLPVTILGGIALLWSLVSNSEIGFKSYPIAINVAMLVVFAYSLYKPPTVIESIARLSEKNMSEQAKSYTKKVTILWCVFFITNGFISLYTALFSSLKTWTLYNGLIAYVLMAILMTVEYIVRCRVKQRHLASDAAKSNLTAEQKLNE